MADSKVYVHPFCEKTTVYGLYHSKSGDFGVRPSPTRDLWRCNLQTEITGSLPTVVYQKIKSSSYEYYKIVERLKEAVTKGDIGGSKPIGAATSDTTVQCPVFPPENPCWVNANFQGANSNIRFDIQVDDKVYKTPTRAEMKAVLGDKYYIGGITGVFELRISPNTPNVRYINFCGTGIRLKSIDYCPEVKNEKIDMDF